MKRATLMRAIVFLRDWLIVFFLASPLLFALVPDVPAHDQVLAPMFIPLLVVAAAYAAGYATLAAVLITLATTVLSFVAQSLLKPAGAAPSVDQGSDGRVRLDNKQTIKQPVAPRRVIYGRTRVGGVYGLLHTRNNNQYLFVTIMLAGHECEAIDEVWFNEEVLTFEGPSGGNVTTGRYAFNALWDFFLGAPGQAASARLLDLAGDVVTASQTYSGICYIAGRLIWDNHFTTEGPLGAKVWTSGIPNTTAVIRGKKIYDPRSGLTVYSNNSALVVADYLCDPLYGPGVDYATGINETALIAAANACDELVTLADGSTEARYTTNGSFLSDSKPDEVLGRLLAAMHGRAIYDGDSWTIIAGVYQTPTITLTDDDMDAASTIQTLTSARDQFNAVKGTYVGPDQGWQAADFPAVRSAAYVELDGGVERFKDIELPFTTSPGRAQRIAKIDLMRARQEIVETFRGKLSCWRVRAGDTVLRSSTRYGWTDKPFEVSAVRFSAAGDEENPRLGIELTLMEIAAEAYDWTADEESTVDPAPNTDFPDIFNVLPPANLTAVESLYATRDGGGVKARVTLAWAASPDAFVASGGQYQAEYRLTGDTTWTVLPRTSAATIDVLDVDPGTYDFRVAAINWAGNASGSISVSLPVVGLAALPAAPTGLSINAAGGLAIVRYDKTADLDVEIGGSIVFRHSAMTSGATWADAVSIADPQPGNLTVAILPLKAGTYLAKFVDSGGRFSSGFASFVQSQASVHTFSTLAGGSLVEDPDFSGTKTNVSALGGQLKLGGAGLFSTIPLLSAVPSVAYWGDVRPSGTYDFSGPIDLGSVKRCRLTVGMTSAVVNVFDLVGSRTTPISTWASFVGDVSGEEADARVEVRTTQTDPAGAPTWTEWARLDSGEFQARGFEFRAQLVSLDPSFDIEISALAVVAEGV
jgi:hypothetical protein